MFVADSLRKYLTFLFITLVVVILFIAYQATLKHKEIRSEINSLMSQEVSVFYNIDNFISKIETVITDISACIRENFIAEKASTHEEYDLVLKSSGKYLKAALLENINFQGIWFIMNPELFSVRKGNVITFQDSSHTSWFYYKDGKIIEVPPDNRIMTPEEDPYYFDTVKQGKMTISNVYEDIDNHTYMLSIANPVYDGNKLIGVVGVDINLNSLKQIFEKIKESAKHLNVYLFDSKGDFILGTETPSQKLSYYAKTTMMTNPEEKIKTSLIDDNWVFFEQQSSVSPYLAGEISVQKLNYKLIFIHYSLYICCFLLILCIISLLIVSNNCLIGKKPHS